MWDFGRPLLVVSREELELFLLYHVKFWAFQQLSQKSDGFCHVVSEHIFSQGSVLQSDG